MRAFLQASCALLACSAASGCVTSAVVGAAGVGLFAAQERTIGEGIDDAAGSAAVKTRLLRADSAAYGRVDVEMAAGRLLLSGSVPSMEHRIEAERIAWTAKQVVEVANELEIGPRSGLFRSALDEAITAQVRTRMLADPQVRGININVETHKGVVYLMGLAANDAELAGAAKAASHVRGVSRVVSYMQLREQSPGMTAAAEAARAQAGAYASADPYADAGADPYAGASPGVGIPGPPPNLAPGEVW